MKVKGRDGFRTPFVRMNHCFLSSVGAILRSKTRDQFYEFAHFKNEFVSSSQHSTHFSFFFSKMFANFS